MNNLDLQYQELLSDILKNGRKKTDRTGMIIEKALTGKTRDGSKKKYQWFSMI